MGILDRFRRPRWQHADAAIRAAAVRDMGAEHQDELSSIARADAEASVRRIALRRLADASVVADIAREDADDSVRQEALAMLLALAVEGREPVPALAALAVLKDQRQLATVAREARLVPLRRAALERLDDPRQLASVARAASDPALRGEALARIRDASVLADLALRSEHKEVAVAAVERLDDVSRLAEVADRARNKWAARRARARLDSLAPTEAAAPSAAPREEALAVETAGEADPRMLEERRQAQDEDRSMAERVALCETVEALEGDAGPEGMDAALLAWEALGPAQHPAVSALSHRFEQAAADARRRAADWTASRARGDRMAVLVAEIESLAHGEDARRFSDLRREWQALEAGGPVSDELQARAARAIAERESRQAEAREERERAVVENQARLEALCVRVEALAAAKDVSLKDADRALRGVRDALGAMGPVSSPAARERFAERLKAARAALFPRAQELREADEWKRWGNATAREELCRRMEALAALTDLEQLARSSRELDAQWAATREVPRGESETLQQRWTAAREAVRGRVDAWLAERKAEEQANLERKRALCERAEALAGVRPWSKAADEMRALQAEWKATGPAPRRDTRALWDRFRAAGTSLFEQHKEDRDRRRQEWSANLERRQSLGARMEALAASTDWDTVLGEAKRLQAEWKTVGAVRKSASDASWQRFKTASDAVFERYRNRHGLDEERQRAEREALCAEVESLAAADAGDDVAARLGAAQERWAALGAPGKDTRPLAERFARARDAVLEASPRSFRGTDLDVEANLQKRERLCERVESLLEEEDADDEPAGEASPAALLASRWREALAANTMGAPDPAAARGQARADEVSAAQVAWDRVGPVPGDAGRAVAERFKKACRQALGERRAALR